MQNSKKFKMSYTLILFSFGFIILGVYRGEISTVLKKAISICLECIGVG